jgi:hypothetical protein
MYLLTRHWTRSLTRVATLVLVLLFAQHHILMVADAAVADSPGAGVSTQVAAAPETAAVDHHSGARDHHSDSHSSQPAPSVHCGLGEATLSSTNASEYANAACLLASVESSLQVVVMATSSPTAGPGLAVAHSTRQALLQVFLS